MLAEPLRSEHILLVPSRLADPEGLGQIQLLLSLVQGVHIYICVENTFASGCFWQHLKPNPDIQSLS